MSLSDSNSTDDPMVIVRRQWNDWRQAECRLDDLDGVHWSDLSGGIGAPAPQYFLHAYIYCDEFVEGEVAHSCRHGTFPHRIKVCIVRKDNSRVIYERLKAEAGPKPKKSKLPK